MDFHSENFKRRFYVSSKELDSYHHLVILLFERNPRKLHMIHYKLT